MLGSMLASIGGLFLASAICAQEANAPKPDAPSLGLRTNRAIARGLAWLRKEQRQDGAWSGHEGEHPGGETALVCYALVKSGVGRGDPMLQAGLTSLNGVEFQSTYSAAVDLLLCEALNDPKRFGSSSRASFDFLLAEQKDGLWAYPSGFVDVSNTQFALLGLRAGRKLGFDVPEKTIERCAIALLRCQDGTGGFGYRVDREPTAGLTAATLAGFEVLAELGKGMGPVESLLGKKKSEIQAGANWLGERFVAQKNAYGASAWTPAFHYAFLWAVERYCGLANRDKLGAHDWYREGAEHLVEEQRADGGWGRTVDDVCFALLFLRRATVTAYEDLSKVYSELDREKTIAAEKPRVRPAASVPRLADWLVAGPFVDKRGAPMLLKPPFAPEKLAPRDKEQLRERVFERWSLRPDTWTDLERLTGRRGDFLLWVLATYVSYSPDASSDKSAGDGAAAGGASSPGAGAKRVAETSSRALEAVLWLAVEDAWKVYFDGKLVSFDERVQAPIEESVCVPLEIQPGVHTLVVLVSDDLGASAFGARLTDPAGRALPASVTIGANSSGKPKTSERKP
jgi:Prenyltransferase and squalene oxidase repeat